MFYVHKAYNKDYKLIISVVPVLRMYLIIS